MRDDVVDTTALTSLSGMADLSSTMVARRYRLAGPLGQGANANVYRAVDLRLNRDVAIKLFHPGQDVAVRVRFAAEAQALARLSHPGLIGIFDAGVIDEGRPYLVMQLVDGESLRDRLLGGGPLAFDDVVALGLRLAAGLAHVHANGIVHRDIKPSNILLDGQGLPHLADFGIALLLDAARMTGSNEILGTAAYLAPEQIMGENVGAPADVYSLGLVLLECLTGELEYPGASKVESALARLHRPPRVPIGLPPALAQLLADMTARIAADRPSAAECASRLMAVRQADGPTSRLARLPRPPQRILRRPTLGWRRLAVAGSGLAIAIIASAWMLTSLLPHVSPSGRFDVPHAGARHIDSTGQPGGTDWSGGSGDLPGDTGGNLAIPVVAIGPGQYDAGTSVTGTPATTPQLQPQSQPDPNNPAGPTTRNDPATQNPTTTTATRLVFGPNPTTTTTAPHSNPPSRHHNHPAPTATTTTAAVPS